MVRSAAKNHKDVLIVTDVNDYDTVIERLKNGTVDLEFRQENGNESIVVTAYYDSMIARYFSKYIGKEAPTFTTGLKKECPLLWRKSASKCNALY